MVEKYSDDEFEALLGKYDYNFKRGDIVKGVVCAYERHWLPNVEIVFELKADADIPRQDGCRGSKDWIHTYPFPLSFIKINCTVLRRGSRCSSVLPFQSPLRFPKASGKDSPE